LTSYSLNPLQFVEDRAGEGRVGAIERGKQAGGNKGWSSPIRHSVLNEGRLWLGFGNAIEEERSWLCWCDGVVLSQVER
jgi:hypothetical protein